MPNPQIDKVNVNGTTYDVVDSTSGYVTSQEAAAAAPVQSVNGSTGNVTVTVPSKTSDLQNDSGFITGISSTDVTTALGYTPYDGTTNPNSYISTETDPTVPSWAKESSKPSYTAREVGAVATSAVGAASGVAPLNASSKIDSTYLPSYVDDVVEGYYYNSKFYKESTHTTEITGETGKIYVDLSTDKTYRYSGSAYVEISSGSLVSVSRDLTSGTKIATITVNGSGSDIYAPTPPSAGSTATAVSTTSSGGSATTWAKSDHVHSISSSTITSALGFTPYNSTNPNGYISGITSSDVTTALGFTPYNSTNPNGYISGISSADVTDALGFTPYNASNPSGYISGITSSDVTTALGFTPYNSTNPNGYTSNTGTVTSIGLSNATNGGLSVTGSPVSTSGTISIGHSNVLTAAQTTQALYPIAIDKNGHITSYGSAASIPTVPTNVSAFTNDAGYLTLSTLPIYDGTVVSS